MIGLKKTPLRRVSKKRRRILAEEAIIEKILLEKCEGKCMLCGKLAPLEKSHTRRRDRFAMVCHECHFPKNQHKYLDEEVKDG